ncbi:MULTISPECIES: HTH-type transcriptional regulator HdfR [Rahnella]|uniref:HTH-type transcriptional regulator HdfR n=1 Tax=Rahnella variigena TaxID=574964 RepID=A0ABX9PTS5_9GAMM|nr:MULTISPECIES: HTH-type transcriptional regulator HdfR [Rahnella]RBQ33308.1 HTH-type transcriptional regulator HdfR [Rahnella aquatilis]RJT52414.1 HTH-type transcriptional regulator HdfR [Rahnella variigena]RKF67626.1 HTH-type transcriptional regulator HdfR [Rahnella variigena]RYJ16188.1 HTH-type transcriptional regulator HdfR [Rahnella variigena]TCQ84391.1 DNA-binding transcriptional LysR family regulator [Rahnella sp. JUb53]
MDTELLKTFLEVSRTRHFGRAAESLYLTQSAVSFRIRQLETQLGANLFTRHRNNIRLTPAGERLLPYAENLMSTWQMAKKEVVRSLQHTELSIGATASLWEAYLTPWLQSLYTQRGALRLEARIALRQSLVKQLHERQLDLLITTEPPKMDELSSQLLGNFSLRLFSSQKTVREEHPPYVKLEWGADFPQQEKLQNSDQEPVLTTTSAHLTRQLLENTGGCAFLPAHWAKEYPQLSVHEEIPPVIRPLYAVWLQTSDQQVLIRQLLKTPLITNL